MVQANEQDSTNGEPNKPELLPRGDKGEEIVEVLAEMYRSTHKPEHAVDDARDTRASKEGMDTEE